MFLVYHAQHDIDKPFPKGKCYCCGKIVKVTYGHSGVKPWCFNCTKAAYPDLKRFFILEKAKYYAKTQKLLEKL